ncbi:MAG: alpha-amylase [Lachnospiraceae bacterium]|nr:alpha-amylase [Lachnospiraceae bacterium]
MARDTKKNLRNQIMYSVFVRNHSPEGTFEGVRRDLERIRRLGVDIVWLMPIHPVGEKNRKGSLGSPYAIRDYRAVNPEFGTLDDFKRLVDDIHAHGMRCVIDVVYNHTSPDSWLAEHHPEWFYRKADGSMGNRVGDWWDVVDLDYGNRDLWTYQIETLRQWAGIVDGFRCDVAPLVPLEFWLEARKEVAKVNADCLWLSESVEPEFTMANRAQGIASLSDSEIFQAFDLCYEYDVYGYWRGYLEGKNTLAEYAGRITDQEYIYPDNYVKLRFLENHDNPRTHFLIPQERALKNWTAFLYFQKGMTLLYAGQEKGCCHRPSLFDRDLVEWETGTDWQPYLQALAKLRREPLLMDSRYEVRALSGEVLYASHQKDGQALVGIFSMQGKPVLVRTDLPDGVYENKIDGKPVEVCHGLMSCTGEPVVVLRT